MEDTKLLDIASDTFKKIESSFPDLKFNYDFNHKYVDMSVDIPKQKGLDFDINLNLQTDELHISTKHFWGSWFTIKNPEVVQLYLDAVIGLLSGKYRIVQYWDGDTLAKSLLQKPVGDKWTTVFTDRKKLFFLSLFCSQTVIQNKT